jgi:hypothetical protein
MLNQQPLHAAAERAHVLLQQLNVPNFNMMSTLRTPPLDEVANSIKGLLIWLHQVLTSVGLALHSHTPHAGPAEAFHAIQTQFPLSTRT